MLDGWVTHLLGLLGCFTSCSLSWSTLSAVQRARREGSLGGLDTRLFGLYHFANTLWCGYCVMLGDGWVFLSAALPGAMWLHFCLTAVQLLALEEGELQPTPFLKLERQSQPDCLPMAVWHRRSRSFRMGELVAIQRQVVGTYLLTGLLAFVLLSDSVCGLEAVYEAFTRDVRREVYAWVCLLASIACFTSPALRIWAIIKSRDASTIYVPYCLAQGVHNGIWFAFGCEKGLYSLLIPQGLGLLTVATQLSLWLAFSACRKSPGAGEKACDVEGNAKVMTKERVRELCPDGLYEDYLRWQTDYRQLRLSGTHHGPHDEEAVPGRAGPGADEKRWLNLVPSSRKS